MPFLVREILLVSTLYDSFLLDEDGRFAERLLAEYLELHLSSPPRMTHVTTGEAALAHLQTHHYDLVITTARIGDMPAPELARRARRYGSHVPVVLLAYDARSTAQMVQEQEVAPFDGVFVWRGDSRLLLALAKSIEDARNAPHDTRNNLVRVIIVVEDSPFVYSSLLPLLYTEVMQHTRSLTAGGINHVDRLYRMRSRPKILLARSFEEAEQLYEKFHDYTFAIVSDLQIPRNGEQDPEAGLDFLRNVRAQDRDVPVLLQSAEPCAVAAAQELNAVVIDKNSPEFFAGIRNFLGHSCGFGDFIFRTPEGEEVGRATNSNEMKQQLARVDPAALSLHARLNHFSQWLMARGKFGMALRFKDLSEDDFGDVEKLREYMVQTFQTFMERRQRGHITDFSRAAEHLSRDFVRLGEGSLGGKGRGVAFIYKLLAHSEIHEHFPDVHILVPRTTVICTGEFDRFIEGHNLLERSKDAKTDEEIAHLFLKSRISNDIHEDLHALLHEVRYPLAVRSSSLLEDSEFQPFAGVYATYMLPNNDNTMRIRLRQLRRAIKLVYSSTYFTAARAYMKAIHQPVEEERMAVLIQRLIGANYGDRFYPTFSGVAQSHNYYPIRYMKPEDGIAVAALGLGRTVVQGGASLRFSPAHPHILPQMSTPDQALRNSQRNFYAVAMSRPRVRVTLHEEDTLVAPALSVAETDGTLEAVGATYSPREDRIYDSIHRPGTRIVNFAPVLKFDRFPLAELLSEILAIGEKSMGCPVEMEYAVNLNVPKGRRPEFAVLQIRPLGSAQMTTKSELTGDEEHIILASTRALGNGFTEGIRDIVYIPPDRFDPSHTVAIANEVEHINAILVAQARPYILIGPGRWGTSDPLLGIPVRWSQVSAARIIVELALEGFDVDPSQGTHFFHNITSLRVGYLAVDSRKKDEKIDWDWLETQPRVKELKFVRHARLDQGLTVEIDGKARRGLVLRSTND